MTEHRGLSVLSNAAPNSSRVNPGSRRHYIGFQEHRAEVNSVARRIYLFQAPSPAQGELLEAFMRSANIHIQALPLEDEESLITGRTYTNRGQCAPVVYQTGSLIKYLSALRKQGISDETILQDYAFIAVKPSGGACRLPTYEEEYRKALAAIGLQDFVLEFVDVGVVRPSVSGLQLNRQFYLRLFLAIMIGDILNDIERRVRPYETTVGTTDRVMHQVRNLIGASYKDGAPRALERALTVARRLIETISVDLVQLKPKVRVVGEYYVASTAGHCTGDMFRWLESQGAEVSVWPVTVYLLHKLWHRIWITGQAFRARKERSAGDWKAFIGTVLKARLLYWTLVRTHRKYVRLLGGYAYPLPDLSKMVKVTDALYHRAFLCGEGFLEIGEHIQAARHNTADMVLSLKAFTCMPSVCSDGVQSKIEQEEPNSVFLALEMCGDAVANARSRIQMKLSDAQERLNAKLNALATRLDTSPAQVVVAMREKHPTIRELRIRGKVPGCTFLSLAEELLS